MLKHRFLPLSLVMAATLAACAATPPTNSLLDEARNDYAAAQSNVEVVQLAPGALSEAGDAMNKANDAASRREESAKVDQLAYIAKQRVAIAQQTAKQKSAEAAFTSAVADRDKMRLEARTAEADALRRDAAESQRQYEASMRQAQDADARSRQLEGQLKELDAKKTSRGLVITLGDVLFDTGQTQMKAGGMRAVQKLADVLKEYPQRAVLVEGFTDSTGGSEYNQGLSDRRAKAVRTALLESGVSADRITDRGYGEAFPVASNATASGRQLNRRVEIVVSDAGKAIAPR
ncbi:MAG TPA: OmpA family protein [Burkholderiales bacterium]|nr:OmpA family protein [Burkholderiales bacterium]